MVTLLSFFNSSKLKYFLSLYSAAKYLKQGDKIGWGVLFPEDEDNTVGKNNEQLIICYLTVNRTVGYVRVLYQPVGGLYPVIIAPPNGISFIYIIFLLFSFLLKLIVYKWIFQLHESQHKILLLNKFKQFLLMLNNKLKKNNEN
jgi:hypothetical protein